jgi:hypothetical protein
MFDSRLASLTKYMPYLFFFPRRRARTIRALDGLPFFRVR